MRISTKKTTFKSVYQNKDKTKFVGTQDLYMVLGYKMTDATGKQFKIGLNERLSFVSDIRLNNPKLYVVIGDFCVPFASWDSLNTRLEEIVKTKNFKEMFEHLKRGLHETI